MSQNKTLRESFQEEFGGEIAGWRDDIITFDSVADFFISKMRERIEGEPTLNTLNFPEGEVQLIARDDLLEYLK